MSGSRKWSVDDIMKENISASSRKFSKSPAKNNQTWISSKVQHQLHNWWKCKEEIILTTPCECNHKNQNDET